MTVPKLLARQLQAEMEALGCMITLDEAEAIIERLFGRASAIADAVTTGLEARIARLRAPPPLRLVTAEET